MNHLRLNKAIHSLGKNRHAFAQTIENTVQAVSNSKVNVVCLPRDVNNRINSFIATTFVQTVDQGHFVFPLEDFMHPL